MAFQFAHGVPRAQGLNTITLEQKTLWALAPRHCSAAHVLILFPRSPWEHAFSKLCFARRSTVNEDGKQSPGARDAYPGRAWVRGKRLMPPRLSPGSSFRSGQRESEDEVLQQFAHAIVPPAPGFDAITMELETSSCNVIAQHCAAGRRMKDERTIVFRLQNSRNSLESINQIGTRKVKLREIEKMDPAQGSDIRRCRRICRRRSPGYSHGCGAIRTDNSADAGRFDQSGRHQQTCQAEIA